MSWTTDISTVDGARYVGAIENNAALTAPDPRASEQATALRNAEYESIMNWGNRLLQLAGLGDQTSTHLNGIADAVDWKGDGATAFQGVMSRTTPKLSDLSQSYEDAGHAIFVYGNKIYDYQPWFEGYAHTIAEKTYELTGYDDSSGKWVIAPKPKVLPGSPNYQSTSNDLMTAKSNGQAVLTEFETARRTLAAALQAATEKAPTAPPFWLRQIDTELDELSGLKGVTKLDEQRARDLKAAEAAYLKNPTNANQKRLDEDLAAVSAIATVAAASGKTGLADRLLDDEAVSLQGLSNAENHTNPGQNVAATQAEQTQIAADLRAGNVKGAERELKEMATTAEAVVPACVPTVAARNMAARQAASVQKEVNQEVASMNSGLTTSQQTQINEMLKQADSLEGKPYVWGGGHGGWGPSTGYDCSGFVSKVLHAAGYLSAPCTTQNLPGQPGISNGPGQHVTIYDRTDGLDGGDHVIINIDGHWFESGGQAGAWGGGGGVAAISKPSASYLASFNTLLHPTGL
jgi:cell wall-associated NlpC family hydrolase